MSKLATQEQKIQMGLRLLAVRKQQRLNQEQMSIALGLSLRAYANYERGEREMPSTLIMQLLREFRCDPLWLLEGESKEPQRVSSRAFDPEQMKTAYLLVVEEAQRGDGAPLTRDATIRAACAAYQFSVLDPDLDPKKIKLIVDLLR